MVLFIAAVLLAAGVLLFTLVVRPSDIPEPAPVSPVAHLEERKARIYENLRDLQFEYRLGKLSDEDYQKTKKGLQAELAGVLAEIEKLIPAPAEQAAAAAPAHSDAKARPDGKTCPHCGAKMPAPMKFCGACGREME